MGLRIKKKIRVAVATRYGFVYWEKMMQNEIATLYDQHGKKHDMKIIPKFRIEDVDPRFGSGIHPAFVVGGIEIDAICIGMEHEEDENGRAIVRVDFDQAKKHCADKGDGWHLMTNLEWSAMVMWSIKEGENAIDEIGTIWEWVDGLKLADGQIIMPIDNDFMANESEWKRFDIYVDFEDMVPVFSNAVTNQDYDGDRWSDIKVRDGVVVDELLLKAMIIPPDQHDMSDIKGYFWADNCGERVPLRGGTWYNGADAGLGALNLFFARSYSNGNIGFRPAYIEPMNTRTEVSENNQEEKGM